MDRRAAVIVGAFILTGAVMPSAYAQASEDPRHLGVLMKGDAVFDEVYIEDSLNPFAAIGGVECGIPITACYTFTFQVAETANRLRVALSDLSFLEDIRLEVYAPDGDLVAAGSSTWAVERFISEPALGTWTVRIIGQFAEDTPVWFRAKLEDMRSHGNPRRALLPNLRTAPPFDLTFALPASLLGPGLQNGVADPLSCTPTETARHGVTRCLRFSMGPENVGDGQLDLRYTADPTKDRLSVTQVIHRQDGSTEERPAGTVWFHAIHQHYHYDEFSNFELFRVVDETTGEMVYVSTSPKQGYCAADYRIVDWQSFAQEEKKIHSYCDGNLESGLEPSRTVLHAGWGDVYGWSFEDNFVDFTGQPAGRYVINAQADPNDRVLETNDKDNWGYTYIEVRGDQIEVIERGYGRDPWDPRKQIVNDDHLTLYADTHWLPFTDLR